MFVHLGKGFPLNSTRVFHPGPSDVLPQASDKQDRRNTRLNLNEEAYSSTAVVIKKCNGTRSSVSCWDSSFEGGSWVLSFSCV